ncbi:MAG: mercury methylation corrinoid protein HgcA [Lentisphaerota bacterium]
MKTTDPADIEKRAGPEWTLGDYLDAIAVRLNIGRMRRIVTPGLYAMGSPGPEAPVFVSANYKLSFDHVRRALAGIDAWILVLDTAGVNVWCAAGKGTFGTDELVRKIGECRLADRVTHRRLILPQLGAPGVAAHEVRKQTGFSVIYGPVYARDIPAFLKAGLKAAPDMRRIHFAWHERLAVAPLELVIHFKKMLLPGLALALLTGLSRQGFSLSTAWQQGSSVLALWVASYGLAGLLGPLLLPWLPARAFSIKGAALGAALAVLGIWAMGFGWPGLRSAAWIALVSAGVSHLLFNFTGSTTFTSPSGVRRELHFALPSQMAAGALGLAAWIASGYFPV